MLSARSRTWKSRFTPCRWCGALSHSIHLEAMGRPMLAKLKVDFDGILELVQKCPANLQETALKTILEHWLTSNTATLSKTQGGQGSATVPSSSSTSVPEPVKTFMTAHGITAETMAKAFHPVGAGAQLLVSEIAGSGKSLKQANLALLLAVRNALGHRLVHVHAQGAAGDGGPLRLL
jgi:hypothetical protein